MKISENFTDEQILKIKTDFESGIIVFNSDKQIEWLEDVIEKYERFKGETRCSPALKDFLTRILNGHYSSEHEEDMWNYKG